MKFVKSLSAENIKDLEIAINQFNRQVGTFATQVFWNGKGYDALLYYEAPQEFT